MPALPTMARRRADQEAESCSESALREIVLRRLAHAPRTRAELQRDLARRAVDPLVVEVVLDQVAGMGLIDDAQFAQMWVQSRHAGRGLSRSALRRELQSRGVTPEIIADALDGIDDDSERQRALDLARRRARVVVRGDRSTRRRRIATYLVRRGYSEGTATAITDEVLREELEVTV